MKTETDRDTSDADRDSGDEEDLAPLRCWDCNVNFTSRHYLYQHLLHHVRQPRLQLERLPSPPAAPGGLRLVLKSSGSPDTYRIISPTHAPASPTYGLGVDGVKTEPGLLDDDVDEKSAVAPPPQQQHQQPPTIADPIELAPLEPKLEEGEEEERRGRAPSTPASAIFDGGDGDDEDEPPPSGEDSSDEERGKGDSTAPIATAGLGCPVPTVGNGGPNGNFGAGAPVPGAEPTPPPDPSPDYPKIRIKTTGLLKDDPPVHDDKLTITEITDDNPTGDPDLVLGNNGSSGNMWSTPSLEDPLKLPSDGDDGNILSLFNNNDRAKDLGFSTSENEFISLDRFDERNRGALQVYNPSSSAVVPTHSNPLDTLAGLPMQALAQQVQRLQPTGNGQGLHQQNVLINIQQYTGPPPQQHQQHPPPPPHGYPPPPQHNMYGHYPPPPQPHPGMHQPYQPYQSPNMYYPPSPYPPQPMAPPPPQQMMGQPGPPPPPGQPGGPPPLSQPQQQPSIQAPPAPQQSGPPRPGGPPQQPYRQPGPRGAGPMGGPRGPGQQGPRGGPPPPRGGMVPNRARAPMIRPRGAGVTPMRGIRPRMAGPQNGVRPQQPGQSPTKRTPDQINSIQAKKKRLDVLMPSDKDDDDCQVICMQPKNTDGGLPQIESVQGGSETAESSIMHLSDSITLSVRNPPPKPAPVGPQKAEAKAVANILATRGITVTASPKGKPDSPQKTGGAQSGVPTALSLNGSVSIVASKGNGKPSQDGLPTVDLTDDAPSSPATNRHGLPYRCDLCPAQYPNAAGLSKHRQAYHKTAGGMCELAIPLINLRQPGIMQRLAKLGIDSYIPMPPAGPDGMYALPIVNARNAGNVSAMGATQVLSLGPARSVPKQQVGPNGPPMKK